MPRKSRNGIRFTPHFLDRMIDATAADPKVDVIIWPESAIYTALNYADRHIERLRRAAGRADVIFGILRIDEQTAFIIHWSYRTRINRRRFMTNATLCPLANTSRLRIGCSAMDLDLPLNSLGLGFLRDALPPP